MRILIVEDSPLVQQMYGLAFSRREHKLTTATDGRAALAQLADPASGFDVILIDLRMPGMNGVEFLREVRRDARLARLPIVLTTMEPEESELLREARASRGDGGGEEALAPAAAPRPGGANHPRL